ncbi:MAG: NAD(P)-dependent oxidoreductase [Ignavibacteriae bacterium]|nr:MAG: NAD(P)-dependent oxidoreductase [Ignavibacteriota bacterium]
MNIAFIGLGIMGSRMASNLIKSGRRLNVYNRTKSKANGLGSNALVKDTPADAVKDAGVVFTMLSTPQAVKETALGENGFLNAMESGSIWVDSSTVNPSFTKLMAEEAKKRNVRFIDAPVAGSKIPAENAQLVFFAGGDKKDVDEVMHLLEVMGKKVVYTGANGTGASMKMIANTLLGQCMLAFAEAVLFGEALGFDKNFLFENLTSLPVTAPFCAAKTEKIDKEDFSPEFPLQWMQKDLELASETAYECNTALPSLSNTKELYALAKRQGMAEMDISAIYKFLKKSE